MENLKNKKFGRLTVVEYAGSRKHLGRYYQCKCDCGNEKVVAAKHLRSGATTSCGCKKNESENGNHLLVYGEAAFRGFFRSYQKRAREKNKEFEISSDEFRKIIAENCFYCGAKPVMGYAHKNANGNFERNGIDRKDNSLGYIRGNIVACCKTCNRMKGDLPEKEFIEQIKKILNKK